MGNVVLRMSCKLLSAIPADSVIRDKGEAVLFIKPLLTLSSRTINWLTVKMTKSDEVATLKKTYNGIKQKTSLKFQKDAFYYITLYEIVS